MRLDKIVSFFSLSIFIHSICVESVLDATTFAGHIDAFKTLGIFNWIFTNHPDSCQTLFQSKHCTSSCVQAQFKDSTSTIRLTTFLSSRNFSDLFAFSKMLKNVKERNPINSLIFERTRFWYRDLIGFRFDQKAVPEWKKKPAKSYLKNVIKIDYWITWTIERVREAEDRQRSKRSMRNY